MLDAPAVTQPHCVHWAALQASVRQGGAALQWA